MVHYDGSLHWVPTGGPQKSKLRLYEILVSLNVCINIFMYGRSLMSYNHCS